ncbi:sterol o-acyltransferase like [Lecanosticta acicola]|uniref:O-acyltransferase n=1 Tax=Lecanosticta acicola TaxID=111012 RepID=A0AAI8Z651_9PEZI|nr:sterol o-acyltransferase like [Lecanosticta acicola]
MTRPHAAAAAEPPQRPGLSSRDTLDANNLTGTLREDGTAALRPDPTPTMPGSHGINGSLSASAEPEDEATGHSERSDSVASDDSDSQIESYEELQLDPDTLIVNTRASMDASYRPAEMDNISSDSKWKEPEQGRHRKRNSIQIRLEKTDKKGRYVLTADDPEIKEILRRGIEREEQEAGRSRKPRIRFRDLVFTRQFTTFDRQNPASAESPFFGFFTLFWICMSLIFAQVAIRNWRDYGSILGRNQVMRMMFSRDVLILGITDGVMYAATFEGVIFQKLVSKGYINWAKSGWIIQNLWQMAYLASIIWWAYFREWPWTHTIFVVLHGLVFLMKQHSYAFYNGYLSSVHRRRALLERRLKQLELMEPVGSRPTSPVSPTLITSFDAHDSKTDSSSNRRQSMGPRTSTNLNVEKSDVAQVAQAIESGHSIDVDQMTTFSSIIRKEMDDLTKELKGKAESASNAFPNNLTIGNFAEYICLPTLVYELEYPRQEKINWWYVVEKTVATFGVLCVMQVVSQGYIYPLVAKTMRMKESGMTLDERWREFPFIVSDMLFPMLIEQLLTWYLIWECILNVLAEVTRFADRGFYGAWWNSVTWDQYARDWNRPVHNFLLRHVYNSSISTFHLSRTAATFVTFLLSALVHEMCMALMFKKVRGYLFWLQLLQMPLVALGRSKLMRGRVVLGNTIFWFGLFIGPAVLTSLYLVV